MTQADEASRIDRLEILFSEQENTIETLNSVITQQAKDIDYFNLQIELLKQQINDLKKQMPQMPVVDEKPPHY